MSWTPESTSALSTTMTSNSVEESLQKLMNEFMAGWLNGGTHTINNVSVVFPTALITNQRATIQQPLEGASVNVTLLNPGEMRVKWCPIRNNTTGVVTTKRRILAHIALDIWVRAMVKIPRTDGRNAESLVRWVTDSIWRIFIDRPLCIPLARAGVTHVRPRLGVLSVSPDYAMRSIVCRAKLDFPIDA
jgi:hypothetical protein